MDVGEKVALEKENLQVHQVLLPQALMLIVGSGLYGIIQ